MEKSSRVLKGVEPIGARPAQLRQQGVIRHLDVGIHRPPNTEEGYPKLCFNI